MADYNDSDAAKTSHQPAWSSHNPVPTVQSYRASKKQTDESKVAGNSHVDDGDDDSNEQNGGSQEIQQQDQVDTSEVPAMSTDPKQRRKEMQRRSPNTARRTVTDPVTHLPVQIRDYTDDDMKKAEHGDEEKKPLSASAAKVQQEANMPEILMKDGDGTRPLTAAEKNKLNVSKLFREYGDAGKSIGMYQNDVVKKEIRMYTDDPKKPGLGSDAKRIGLYINSLQEQAHHDDVEESLPTDFDQAKKELTALFVFALCTSLAVILLGSLVAFFVWNFAFSDPKGLKSRPRKTLEMVGCIVGVILFSTFLISGLRNWYQRQTQYIWDDEVDMAEQRRSENSKESKLPESTRWLNLLIASIWPMINPDLFSSIADLLEDVMQASLPKLVRMVSVEDIGQGSEPFRIMGIRWLPKGEAAKSVSDDELLGSDDPQQDDSDQKANGEGNDDEKKAEGETQDANTKDSMEGESGEFVNVEIAFAYRAQARDKEMNIKKKNAHLYLAFYLPGHIKLPVWVELRGLVGTMRARLQLTPDPPFVELCTITFLGQPKVDMSCVPLTKKGLNIMDVPLISNFVQSAVNAALAGYVAPKSLTLDLKAMLAGDDFKRDTDARGVLVVRIKRAFDFKEGDVAIPLFREGSSDPYVSVGWAKLGKPAWSTRVLINDMEPYWEEEGYMVFGPEELDAEEKLRVQLWDSDRTTADDDLGRVEIDLKELMSNEKFKGKMWNRTDTFEAMKAGEKMPGRFEWSVGCFRKLKLRDSQVKEQSSDESVNTVDELRQQVYAKSAKKLREVSQDASAEIQQQKEQDFEAAQIDMISNSAPLEDYPSGVLSIQIHQVTGLQLEQLNRSRAHDGGDPETDEIEDANLPDSYCTIIMNHQKIFKTRTKPKSSKPFFNACIERFVRDWRTAIVHISVRDGRVHEDDPLIGVVCLPLADMFRERKASYFNEVFPLAGGIGYGRARVSVVFRSIDLQAPKPALGWDTFGTVEVFPEVEVGKDGMPDEYKKHKLKIRTGLTKTHMNYDSSQPGRWQGKSEQALTLAVRKRHSTNILFELSGPASFFGGHSEPAYAVLWLQDIPDEDEQNIDMPVYKGNMARAEVNKLPEEQMGEKVGSLKVSIWFSRGLSRAHRKIASDNKNISDVMEVLECTEATAFNVGDWSSDEESDEEDAQPKEEGSSTQNEGGKNLANPPSLVSEAKGYQSQKAQMHDRHRGLMQWKGPRTLKWIKGKGQQMVNKVEGSFEHQGREPDIGTEA